MAVHKQMNATEWALLIALSILWGGSFFFVGIAVKELPPVTIVTLRVSIAALALLTVCRIMGYHMPKAPKYADRHDLILANHCFT
ncbi:putative DMT superfamily transporter inner membrane protein [Agrobacterium rosae]|uniref:Putative DMT superfamily transporter inner membrane protein n=1 Tax=Agrobacterium rosae TaxID=1972867 RepID=A0A1R3T9F4_9HYPH|nr:putative DMT superfamily transporter inner membrane protein [Agrobacterium rosae]